MFYCLCAVWVLKWVYSHNRLCDLVSSWNPIVQRLVKRAKNIKYILLQNCIKILQLCCSPKCFLGRWNLWWITKDPGRSVMFQCVREHGSVACILARSETLVRSTKFLKQSQGQFLCFYAFDITRFMLHLGYTRCNRWCLNWNLVFK